MAVRKRGAALIIAIMFLTVAMIISVGMYASAYNFAKMQGMREVRRIRGYYAAIGALRYMTTVTLAQGTKSVKNDYGTLWNDLNLKGSEDVAITVTGPDAGGQYTVSARYSY